MFISVCLILLGKLPVLRIVIASLVLGFSLGFILILILGFGGWYCGLSAHYLVGAKYFYQFRSSDEFQIRHLLRLVLTLMRGAIRKLRLKDEMSIGW